LVVIGDDEVEAETARGFSFSEGAHASVDGDDDADAIGVSSFKNAGLHAVAVAQAVRDVKSDEIAPGAGKHFNGGFEQDDGDGAVNVVIAVEKDGFAGGDGVFDALDGDGHSEHEKGIVEVRRFGIQKGEGVGCGGYAARDKQLGEDERQASFAGQGCGQFVVGFGEEPALGRQSARWS
jgi:hypothetical protein